MLCARSRIASACIICIALILWASNVKGAQATVFHFVTNDGVVQNALYRMELGGSAGTLVGTIDYTGGVIWELDSARAGTAYGIARGPDWVYEISLLTGEVVSTVPLDANIYTNGRGMATAPDGTLYGLFDVWDLRTIDPSTGRTTLVASVTGITGGIEAMCFAPDGTLYAAASPDTGASGSHLYTLDVSNGEMSLIGSIGNSYIDIDTMAFASDGYLYGVDTLGYDWTDLYRIDPSTGNKTFVTELYGGVNGLHFGPIPEPTTLSLVLFGALGLTRMRHRREGL